MKYFIIVAFSLLLITCKRENTSIPKEKEINKIESSVEEKYIDKDSIIEKSSEKEILNEESKTSTDDKAIKSDFKEITTGSGIAIDIKYATENNFTKKQIYNCGKCFLRPEATEKIVQAHKALKAKHGFGLKMFDCYRPLPAQQRLWDVVPNADYVTPPSKGSMHNKGLAVDLTIVDKDGKELDMGTPYDFFGKEAHTDNMNHPKHVLENRKMLKDVMNEVGFKGIRTEWWHFSLNTNAALSSWEWKCN